MRPHLEAFSTTPTNPWYLKWMSQRLKETWYKFQPERTKWRLIKLNTRKRMSQASKKFKFKLPAKFSPSDRSLPKCLWEQAVSSSILIMITKKVTLLWRLCLSNTVLRGSWWKSQFFSLSFTTSFSSLSNLGTESHLRTSIWSWKSSRLSFIRLTFSSGLRIWTCS